MKTRCFCFENGRYWGGEENVSAMGDCDVMVQTVQSLVSVGTETACNTGKAGWKKGLHGYSNAGRVVAVGKEVKDFIINDRVTCLKPHTDQFVLKSGEMAYRIPDGVSYEEAVFMTLGMVAMHAVECADISLGRPVVVVGQGTVGQMAQQLARLAGAGKVITVDLDAGKRDLSLALGADASIPNDIEALKKALSMADPAARPPVFIELSGSSKAIEWILEACPLRSDVVILGNYIAPFTMNPLNMVEKEIHLIGCHQPKCPEEPVYGYPYCRKFNGRYILEQIRLGRLKVRELCDGFLKPDEVIAFYDAARDNHGRLNQPIIKWEE